MYCEKCGSALDENNVCPTCKGEKLDVDAAVGEPSVEAPAVEPVEVQPAPAQAAPAKKYSGKCISGFVMSLVGMLVVAIPCGIIGLVFSSLGMKEVETTAQKGKGLAIAGLVVSILDIVFGIVNVASFL